VYCRLKEIDYPVVSTFPQRNYGSEDEIKLKLSKNKKKKARHRI